MSEIILVKICEECNEEYLIYPEHGESEDKECPNCAEVQIEFIPDDDLTFDILM